MRHVHLPGVLLDIDLAQDIGSRVAQEIVQRLEGE